MGRRAGLWVVATTLVALALPAVAGADGGRYGAGDNFSGFNGAGFVVHHGSDGESDVNVCNQSLPGGRAACQARVVTQPAASAAASSGPSGTPTSNCPTVDSNAPAAVVAGGNGGYDPCYLQSAYNAASLAESSGGRGQIVAIVDYSIDPSIAADLAAYRSQFGLPPCPSGTVSTSATGCVFQQLAQSGTPTSGSSGWDVEISLDVETVSAICPQCQILLVEASSTSFAALGTAVNTAVADGAIAVSNSYGGSESSGETSVASAYYQHPGVAVTVSSGDRAGVVEFPASAPDVVAVGGTSLLQYSTQGSRSANATETVWNGTPAPGDGAGAGCSAYESAAPWQSNFLSAAGGTALCSRRVTADVSAVADPATGLWVYDTYSQGGWLIVGGTSLASPLVAALYGLMGNAPGSSTYPASTLYANAGSLYHVTSGNVGTCGNYLCDATKSINGFNGPTGLGTPGGAGALGAFAFNPAAPPTPPASPGAPSVVGVTATSVSLSWTADPGASTYTLYQGTSPTSLAPVATGIAATSAVASGLSPSTTYYFALTATNAAGTSGLSPTTTATTGALSVPSAPTGLAAKAGNGSLTLTWSAPTSDGGSPLTGYLVEYSTTPGGEATGSVQAASGPSATLAGLTNGTTYYVEVVATNAVGSSSPSSEVAATPASPPAAPTLLSATAGAGQVTLTWSANSNGGSALTGFVLYDGTGATPGTAVATLSASTLSDTVTGLPSGTTYSFAVVATNAIGSSAPSNVLTATPTGNPPTAPTNVRARTSGSSVALSWRASSGTSPITYTVLMSTSSTMSGALSYSAGTSTSYTVRSLSTSSYYFFEVVATNASGSAASSVVRARG